MQDLMDFMVELLGPSGVLTGPDVQARTAAWGTSIVNRADLLIRPSNTEQLSQALAYCSQHRLPVVVQGGRTGLALGGVNECGDVIVSTERMANIESFDLNAASVTVQAGVVLEQLQSAASEYGLMFPIDLGSKGSAHIGGIISTNAGGNRVLKFGMTRSSVLGLEVVMMDGTVISTMTALPKNNTGLDLKQLFIGTEGTLGVVSRAVLKLHNIPGSQHAALVACDSFDDVLALYRSLQQQLAEKLSAFELMWQSYYALASENLSSRPLPDNYCYYILVEFQSTDSTGGYAQFEQVMATQLDHCCDAVMTKSQAELNALWSVRENVECLQRLAPYYAFDVGLPVRYIPDYVRWLDRQLAALDGEYSTVIFGHLGDGNLHVIVRVDMESDAVKSKVAQVVYQPLAEYGGTISAEHGIGLEKKGYLHFSRSTAEMQLMRSVKQLMDPAGLLNPGKILD